MPPKFIYFDLGNVLLYFDHHLACRQMAEVADLSPEKVWKVLFEDGVELRYESGELDDRQFHEAFCLATGTRPNFERLLRAGSEIFRMNQSIIPVVAQLDAAGYRLGILSNTCSAHWRHCTGGQYGLLNTAFDVTALSFQIGVCKPAAKIFQEAARLASVEPAEIFYIDDMPGHVEGAKQVGFDAVIYTTTQALVDNLFSRGVRLNY